MPRSCHTGPGRKPATPTQELLFLAGAAISAARREHGLAQRELARELGIAQTFLCRIEKGQRPLPGHCRTRLAELVGLQVDPIYNQDRGRGTLRQLVQLFVALPLADRRRLAAVVRAYAGANAVGRERLAQLARELAEGPAGHQASGPAGLAREGLVLTAADPEPSQNSNQTDGGRG